MAREFGGPSRKAGHLSASLRELGCDTTLIGCGWAEGAIGLTPIGRLHATPIPLSVVPVKRAVRDCELVHVLGYRDPVGTAAAHYADRFGKPYLIEPLGMYGPKLRSARMKAAYEVTFGSRLMRGAAAILATSQVEARDLEASGMKATMIAVRPNGVSVDDLLPLPARGIFRKRYGLPQDAPLVLTISRLSITKALPALARAAVEMPGVYFVVAGPDDRDGTLATLESLRETFAMVDRFRVLPQGLWGREKAEAISDADTFCLPSATESFGIAAAEAAALGLPVLLSDRCGGAEYLAPGATRTFRFGQDQDLILKLNTMLSDPELRSTAGAAAPAIRAQLSWSSVGAQQVSIYERVLRTCG